MHIGVFDVLNKVWFQKLTGDVSKNALFFCRFFKVFCICFQNPYFLVLAFPFVAFEFLCFFCSCCCCWINQVAMFWFLFLLYWVSWVCLCVMCRVSFGLFLVSFVLFLLEGLGVR